MAQTETNGNTGDSPERVVLPDSLQRMMLEPLNHGIAAASRKALERGISAERVLELHLNNLASTLAMVEPPQARANALKDVQKALPELLRQHVDARYTTPAGIKLPGVGL